MRVGAVGALGADLELEPERALFPEPDGVGASGVAVEQAVSQYLRMMLHQIAGTPRSKGFLVRNGGQCQPPLEALADAVKEGVGEDRRAGAGLHVAGAATVDLPVDELTAPGVSGPAGPVAHR